ncbi:unnamed protein product, partial [marine sediment metagenome]
MNQSNALNQWLVNGTEAEWDNATGSPSYTNNTLRAGVWNITLISHNSSDSSLMDGYSWVWVVTGDCPSAPLISDTSPASSVSDDLCVNSSRVFSASVNQSNANSRWLVNGTEVEWDNSTGSPSYINNSLGVGVWNITLVSYNASDSSLSDSYSWVWVVTGDCPTAPVISSPSPSMSVGDDLCVNNIRVFSASVNQSNTNNRWLLNGTLQEWDNGTSAPSYMNNSLVVGVWNVTLIAHNSSDSSLTDGYSWVWVV